MAIIKEQSHREKDPPNMGAIQEELTQRTESHLTAKMAMMDDDLLDNLLIDSEQTAQMGT